MLHVVMTLQRINRSMVVRTCTRYAGSASVSATLPYGYTEGLLPDITLMLSLCSACCLTTNGAYWLLLPEIGEGGKAGGFQPLAVILLS